MDRHHVLALKALKRLVADLLLILLLAAICLAVAPTLGYAQEPEPTRQCVDFSDWGEREVEAEFTKDGFVFTALDDEPQLIDITHTPEEVPGLYIAEQGVNISFPQAASQVNLSAVSYTATPLEITAFNPEDAVVAEAITPPVPGTIHTVSLSGWDIVRLVIREGGNESFLVEICIEIEVEQVTEEPFIKVVDPPQGNCGSEIQLSIFGANFEPGSSVFIPEGIETLYTEFISPEELRAGVFIAEDAPPGARPVIVSGPELGEAILEGGFTVICPPPREYTLTMAVNGNGSTNPPVGVHIYPEGEVVPITAIPGDGWEFDGWIGEVADPPLATTIVIMDFNKAVTAEFSEIPQGPGLLPPIIGGAAAILVGIFSTRQVIKVRRRKQWQEKAEEEEPQEPCEPDDQRCQCKEIKCELAQCKIKHLMLLAYDAVSGELSKKRQVEGEIVDGLNQVIAASRRGEKPEKLAGQVVPLAHVLFQQIIEWLRSEPAPRDVSVIGHLEGCKVTYKFILKRCKETRTWGEPGEEWEATIKEERDEPLGVLRDLDPTKPGIPEQLTPELTRLLMQFIEKV